MANSRLEEYVQAATAHLPESDRMLEQREMHQHLIAMIAAHEELGDTKEAATDAALKQLGDARVIRGELLKTHRRAKFHSLMRYQFSEFWTASAAPAAFGVVIGGGICGALYARKRFPLQLGAILTAGSVHTAVVVGLGLAAGQNWFVIASLCALYWGLFLSCALLGFGIGNVLLQPKRESFTTVAKTSNTARSLTALASVALVLVLGGSAGFWQVQHQRQQRTQQLVEKVRIAEAQYQLELQKMHRSR
ncbi:MAG: hypothetical protein V4671_17730 [Armatimonadota bacterium]